MYVSVYVRLCKRHNRPDSVLTVPYPPIPDDGRYEEGKIFTDVLKSLISG